MGTNIKKRKIYSCLVRKRKKKIGASKMTALMREIYKMN